jgi:hypothetical protein
MSPDPLCPRLRRAHPQNSPLCAGAPLDLRRRGHHRWGKDDSPDGAVGTLGPTHTSRSEEGGAREAPSVLVAHRRETGGCDTAPRRRLRQSPQSHDTSGMLGEGRARGSLGAPTTIVAGARERRDKWDGERIINSRNFSAD